ncbi:MAG: imidazole glycerol phosphate synthase subunit HisH [Candidatus Marinimicrobia bacterium]|nr:imidazole glycerol phosphate synthase subunit HisH [Candidatus Neomarinimicrobiota bacterium]
MIGIIDYGIGNIGSLTNAFRFLDIPCIYSGDQKKLSECDRLILPGVGAFQPAMDVLTTLKLDRFIQNWAMDGKHLLGICLGMQLLLSESEENGLTSGLNIIPGKVIPIKGGSRKIHIGWNQVKPVGDHSIVPSKGYAYFVHSYASKPANKTHIAAQTKYGELFASVIQKGSVIGVQFHPEKSQDYGMDILRRFSVEPF